MPNSNNQNSLKGEVVDTCSEKPLIDENVTAQILQIFGNQSNQYVPTQAQVDKILDLQEKGMDYTHEERKNFSPKQKMEITFFLSAVVILVVVFVLCLFFAKEYVGEIVSGLIGFIAGGAGGYGIAKSKVNNGNGD